MPIERHSRTTTVIPAKAGIQEIPSALMGEGDW